MKRYLLLFVASLLFFTFHACKKNEHHGKDVFRVTYLGAGAGCPSGPLIRFAKTDIDRLAPFVHTEFSEGFKDYRVIAAINLSGSYYEGQSIVLKIRKLTDEEMHPCPANVIWYTGVYVLEANTD